MGSVRQEKDKSIWKKMFRRTSVKAIDIQPQDPVYTKKEEPEHKKEEKEEREDFRPRSFSSLNVKESSTIAASKGQFTIPRARKKPQFGIYPSDLLAKNPNESVPAIVTTCISYLEKDLRKEGIFRIPGKATDILEMKISFEQGRGLGVENPDIYAVAGLLALFFRELPEPLLTNSLYLKWIQIPTRYEACKQAKKARRLMKKLPPANYYLLHYFIGFLTRVAKNAGTNRMSSKNLALIFGASLLDPPKDVSYDLNSIKSQCTVIELFIEHYLYMFEGGKESVFTKRERTIATIPAGLSKEEPAPKKKRSFFERPQFASSTTRSHLTSSAPATKFSAVERVTSK